MKFIFQIVFGAMAIGMALIAAGTVDSGANSIRFAFSDTIVGEVNDNDARVAIKGWAEVIMRETSMNIEFDSSVISTAEQILQKIRSHTVDSFAFSMKEYIQVSALVDNMIVIDEAYAKGGDEYLIIVHADSGIHDLAGLRGKAIIQLKHPKMCLAGPWLETILSNTNLSTVSQGGSDGFFVRKTNHIKLAKVVLPVYFRQIDACLVTRQGFETMSEMNPQLTAKMRVIATSPRVIPLFLAFHKDCPQARRQRFADAISGLFRSPSGRQAMMLFQTARLVPSETSLLKPGVDLLTAYEHLKGKSAAHK